mgnify:CR=1 FL=1
MAKAGLVYLRPVPVVYFRVQGPYSTSVNMAWTSMLHWLDTFGLRKSAGRGYGLARDNPRVVGHEKCRYDACVELPSELDPSALETVHTQRLPGGAYARQRHVGQYEQIRDVVVQMRDTWAPNAGLTIDARRPIVTIFLCDPATVGPDQLKADVCIPVSAAADNGRSAA